MPFFFFYPEPVQINYPLTHNQLHIFYIHYNIYRVEKFMNGWKFQESWIWANFKVNFELCDSHTSMELGQILANYVNYWIIASSASAINLLDWPANMRQILNKWKFITQIMKSISELGICDDCKIHAILLIFSVIFRKTTSICYIRCTPNKAIWWQK